MSTITVDLDPESSPQTEVLLHHTTSQRSARDLWHRMRPIMRVLQAHEVLIPVVVDKAKITSLTVSDIIDPESSSYTALPTHNDVAAASENPPSDQDTHLHIQTQSTTYNEDDLGPESPQTEEVIHHTTSYQRSARDLWRRIRPILRVLQAHEVLISIVDKARNTSLTASEIIASESSSYTALPTHDAPTAASENPPTVQDIRLDIQSQNTYDNNNEGFPFSTTIILENLSRLVKDRDLISLIQFGGTERIAAALNTNLDNGICNDSVDLDRRRYEYGSNIYSDTQNPSKGFFHFVFKATKDWTIFLLLCCATLSLGSGIKEEGLKNGWYDGTTIFIAIFILIAVSSISNYWRANNLQKLFNKKTPVIGVLRDGLCESIPVSEVVVGDIVFLEIGDRVPADGLLLNGDNLLVHDDTDDLRIDRVQNPFLFSGAKVIEGSVAHMLVTSVGMNTVWGETISSVKHNPRMQNLLKIRLDKLNSYFQNISLIIAILILVILLLRYLVGKQDDETGYPDLKGKRTAIGELIKAMERLIIKPRGISTTGLTTMVAVLLVGIQEGLSFMITLSLSYWSGKMATKQVIIQELCSAITMGSVTTICTDKSARLTLNKMEVDMLWVGEKAICGDITSVISEEVLEALCDAVGTPVLVCDASTSPVEDPLLPWARSKLGMDMDVLKQSRTVINAKALCPEQKRSGLLMRKHGDAERIIHLHWKGAAETILPMCCHYYDCNGMIKAMDEQKREVLKQVIGDRASKGLHTLGFAYKQIEGGDGGIEDDVMKLHEDGLNLLGLMGLKYPCCPEARRAVAAFLHAGVNIKLVSTDNLSELRTIAIECGIHQPDQNLDAVVLEGEEFRNLSELERMEKVDNISIMASSLPTDKLLLVQCLKQKGQVVAVTGARTSDSAALKEADIGILMGAKYSEKAKESSDIIISNGSLDSMFTVMLTGRCAYGNIQKFIQLELIMNISGLLITFVTTVSLGESPMKAIQLLWVNLMVGTLAVLALLTEPPILELMELPPVPHTEPLVTKPMWRNIITQVLYQAVVLLSIQFKGQMLPGINWKLKKAMILNSFVLCQVFNQINARELEKKNVFNGILGNYRFLAAVGVPILFQVAAVQFITSFIDTARLSCIQWLVCLLIATISWPIDYVVKCIPGISTNRSITLELCILPTSPIPSTPLTSQSQLSDLTVEEKAPVLS